MRSILATMTAIATLVGCGNGTAPSPQQMEWEAAIEGGAGWEQLSGEASVVWTVGAQQFVAMAELFGDEPGAVRPWHVHHNTCAAGGGIVGADGDYPRLSIGADGRASATTSVPVGLSSTAPYHVNIHRSEAEMAVIIACGDLNPVATPAQNPSSPTGPSGPDY